MFYVGYKTRNTNEIEILSYFNTCDCAIDLAKYYAKWYARAGFDSVAKRFIVIKIDNVVKVCWNGEED